MLETACAQLRFAASVAFGAPFSPWSLRRLMAGLRETQYEFGALGPEGDELLGGPALDEATRRAVQLRRFRTQAIRAARGTAYYHALFAQLGLDPTHLRAADISRIPLTPKAALRDDPDAFVRRTARPALRATTTGTTGRPTGIAFSAREVEVIAALSAIGLLFRRELGPGDILQVSISSRAALGVVGSARACASVGALMSLAGVIEPEQALALLTTPHHLAGKKPRVSALLTYPSYLGQLVERGQRLGYRPADFGLERIFVGGEVVTQGLKTRAERLFGPVRYSEGYAMTELAPLAGTPCQEGHLHFEPSQGLVEVCDPETGAPTRPGEAGILVATPFPPYRETTLLLRYDTEDVVRPVAGPLTCPLRSQPATTNILGKLRLSVRHEHGWTYPRDALEALEAIEAVPLPARYGCWAVPGGVAIEVVVQEDEPGVHRAVATCLEERGVPVRELHLVTDPRQLRRPRPLRCDLREASFGWSPLDVASDLPLSLVDVAR